MPDKEPRALIPLPSGGLANIGSGPKSILSGIVSDALALARVREKSLAEKRFRIGDYEFRDPDYRQILIWAKALGIAPEVLINGLEGCSAEKYTWLGTIEGGLEVEEGSIISLTWDFIHFPISSFEWINGLRIRYMGLWGVVSEKILLRLPSLKFLECINCGLTELDLSAVPTLNILFCDDNQLAELDLSTVPGLTVLWCSENQLVELDLSTVPALTQLGCPGNQLVALDLSTVPALTQLWCDDNQLVKLDLLAVPGLTQLWCSGNQLVELDLSRVPALTELDCRNNQLVELDIRGLGELKKFYCDSFVTLKKLPTQNF